MIRLVQVVNNEVFSSLRDTVKSCYKVVGGGIIGVLAAAVALVFCILFAILTVALVIVSQAAILALASIVPTTVLYLTWNYVIVQGFDVMSIDLLQSFIASLGFITITYYLKRIFS